MPKAQKRNYSQSLVNSALEAIASGTPIRKAASQFGVPSSTLFGKVKKKYPVNATMGPSSILSSEEENYLMEWIFYLSEQGFPVTKEQLLDNVQKLVTAMQRVTPFTNNRPGRHWYEAFCRRHPELSKRMSQNMTYSRASATEEKLRNWFQDMSKHLSSKGLLSIDSSRVFSCDEAGFLLSPKADSVIVRRGAKTADKIANVDEKQSISTLFMVNGAGTVAPPMVMFPEQRIPSLIAENLPSGWSFGTSEKGWMTSETFYEYITNVFCPWLQENRIQFPIVLFVDAHSSHCTLPFTEFCREIEIELVGLHPNATHILQPLDVAVFQPLKSAWKEAVDHWRIENNGIQFEEEHFAPLLKATLDSLQLEDTIRNGFRTCGLSPFTADAADSNDNTERVSSPVQPILEITTTPEFPSKFMELLEIMEQQLIPVDVLREFERMDPADLWTGEVSNTGLYECWRKMKQLAGISCRNEVS